MPFDYTDRNASIARVVSLADVDGDNKEPEIGYLLDDSAATKDSLIKYRPQYVAALIIEQNVDVQSLSAATNGIKFTGQVAVIRSLFSTQTALDKTLIKDGYTIPDGFDAASKYREFLLNEGIDPNQITPIMSLTLS